MKKRIIFVDDEPMVLSGLRRSLHGMREVWDMQFVESAEAALQALEKEPCDAIISDIRMPLMDGADLLDQVKQRYPGTVRMILSGQASRGAMFRSIVPAHQFLFQAMRSAGTRESTEPGIRHARPAIKPIREDGRVPSAVASEPAGPVRRGDGSVALRRTFVHTDRPQHLQRRGNGNQDFATGELGVHGHQRPSIQLAAGPDADWPRQRAHPGAVGERLFAI